MIIVEYSRQAIISLFQVVSASCSSTLNKKYYQDFSLGDVLKIIPTVCQDIFVMQQRPSNGSKNPQQGPMSIASIRAYPAMVIHQLKSGRAQL